MNAIAEETETGQATAGEQPKPNKRLTVAKRARNVAPAKAKSGKKASTAKKTPKGAKAAKPAMQETGARDGNKAAKIMELLKRQDGATLKELMKATGWQAHSVRGFLSGTIGKKMGLTVASAKSEDGERSYSVES